VDRGLRPAARNFKIKPDQPARGVNKECGSSSVRLGLKSKRERGKRALVLIVAMDSGD